MKMVSCSIPFMSKTCYGPLKNRFTCWMDLMSDIIYMKCRDSFKNLALKSTNLLLLYSPFTELFLNYSRTIDNLVISIDLNQENSIHDIDLRSLNQINISFNLTLYTWIYSNPATIIFQIYTWYKRSFFSVYDGSVPGILSQWEIIPKKTIHIKTNDIQCYYLTTNNSNYSKEGYFNVDYTCPLNQCSHNNNENRLCLGLIPCLNMGDDILLCQIDRLRLNDKFNLNIEFLSTDVIITTSDTNKQTLHQFSRYLFSSCIAIRLIVIIIYGRLEIPSWNYTSFNCSSGLIMEIEFWHGNCSTFELLNNRYLEHIYQTHFITFGNFFTGEIDRLTFTCMINQSKKSHRNQIRIFDLIIVCLLTIVIIAMCIVGCSYRRYTNH